MPAVPPSSMHWPVAVGGVGGSGTRVVASILREIGYHIGHDLNEACDNLWFTLLFKYREALDLEDDTFVRRLDVFEAAMAGNPQALVPDELETLLGLERAGQHGRAWLQARAASLGGFQPHATRPWAWKEPNTHMLLDRLFARVPRMRYIHVMRNGMDMALSGNQNQLHLWGPRVLGERYRADPGGSLSFWCWAHKRMQEIGCRHDGRVFFVNYDALCDEPVESLLALLGYLGVEPDPTTVRRMAAMVSQPVSRGRFRSGPRGAFDPQDIDFVRSLGYEVV
jgi:hypothetical protein